MNTTCVKYITILFLVLFTLFSLYLIIGDCFSKPMNMAPSKVNEIRTDEYLYGY